MSGDSRVSAGRASGAASRKVSAAPVNVIIGMDLVFYEKLPQLYPPADARAWFASQATPS